jgi:hypothetical protein
MNKGVTTIENIAAINLNFARKRPGMKFEFKLQ